MNISDAIKARTADQPFITRRAWTDEYGPWARFGVKILPTSTPCGCMLETRMPRLDGLEKRPHNMWQPMAADLTAVDWEICG